MRGGDIVLASPGTEAAAGQRFADGKTILPGAWEFIAGEWGVSTPRSASSNPGSLQTPLAGSSRPATIFPPDRECRLAISLLDCFNRLTQSAPGRGWFQSRY